MNYEQMNWQGHLFPRHLKSRAINGLYFTSCFTCYVLFLTLGQVRSSKSTHLYFSSRSSSGETYSDWQQVVDIKCHYWAIHIPPCLRPLFTEKCLSFSHSSWPCSQHVSPFKRAQEIMAVQWFCQRMVQVMIYQAPSVNFSKHKWWSWIMLYTDRPLLDQCWPLHTSWMDNSLMLQSCLHASPQWSRWLWWVMIVFFGGYWSFTWNKTFTMVDYTARYSELPISALPPFHGCNFLYMTLMIGSQSCPWPFLKQNHVILFF